MLCALAVLTAGAQNNRQFEIISIKPANTTDPTAGAVKLDPGERFTARSISAKVLMSIAFDLRPSEISGGPRWIIDDRFEVIAKGSGDEKLTADQIRPMVKGLLISRFRLRYHFEKKEVAAYGLVIAKGGSKLQKTSAPDATPSLLISGDGTTSVITSIRSPLSRLAQTLQMQLGQRVFDRTGLDGAFDYRLLSAPVDAADSPAPSIFTALQDHLGLKLEPEKDSINAVVIDRIEKPSPNSRSRSVLKRVLPDPDA
ncbi:MAG TPA: TIGR03435 family protein [Bryobacteraceae bacterium]|nr:TIGR03435 family protein [Bryobacteraceae bacterium]